MALNNCSLFLKIRIHFEIGGQAAPKAATHAKTSRARRGESAASGEKSDRPLFDGIVGAAKLNTSWAFFQDVLSTSTRF